MHVRVAVMLISLDVCLMQVGNAVPPPLAHALGSQLRRVLEDKRQKEVMAAMMAQMGQ